MVINKKILNNLVSWRSTVQYDSGSMITDILIIEYNPFKLLPTFTKKLKFDRYRNYIPEKKSYNFSMHDSFINCHKQLKEIENGEYQQKILDSIEIATGLNFSVDDFNSICKLRDREDLKI